MIKAVLFDLDGTLVNSLEDLAISTNYALKKNNLPTHEVEKYKYFVGNGMAKLIERVLPAGVSDSETFQKVFDDFMGYYRSHYTDKTVMYDGIDELLYILKEKGLKLAVVSNKAHEMTLNVVDKLLNNRFDFVTGKQEGLPTKPDPKLTRLVMNELQVKADECVFVGDSGMDMAVAVNSGCIGIGVLWGFRTEGELRENGANYIVNKPSEINDIISKL